MLKGTVVWFKDDKGYGFIRPDGVEEGEGNDIFVHYTGIISDAKRKNLRQGQRVEFEIEQEEKGPKAINVCVIG